MLHISYTAKLDDALRDQVEQLNGDFENDLLHLLQQQSLPRLLSLRHDFSHEFNCLLNSSPGNPAYLPITDRHFPIFLNGKVIRIRKADLILQTTADQSIADFRMIVDGRSLATTDADHIFRNDNAVYGGLWSAGLHPSFAAGIFDRHTFSVETAGELASDTTVVDPQKLRNIYLYLEYGIDG
jgi:hypothetical protein